MASHVAEVKLVIVLQDSGDQYYPKFNSLFHTMYTHISKKMGGYCHNKVFYDKQHRSQKRKKISFCFYCF